MPTLRKSIGIAALLLAALAIVTSAKATFATSYRRYKLFELTLDADKVLSGTIVALQAETFDLRVDQTIAGPGPLDVVRIRRFQDWTCAWRWTEYAVGQEVVVFLRAPSSPSPHHTIIGAGGEGEMPRIEGDVIVRGYRVRGFQDERALLGIELLSGPRIPLTEFSAAVQGLRRELRRGEQGQSPWGRSVEPRHGNDSLEAFASTSRTARHLTAEARSSQAWSGPPRPLGRSLEPADLCAIRAGGAGAGFSPIATSLAAAPTFVGDFDGDGIEEVVVDTPPVNLPGYEERELRLLFLDSEGRVRKQSALRPEHGPPDAPRAEPWRYATSMVSLGDLDGNGVADLCVGAPIWPAPDVRRGGVWILFLRADGSLEKCVEIGDSPALRAAGAGAGTGLGASLAPLGDLGRNGTLELAIGIEASSDSAFDDDPPVFLVSLTRNGSVVRATRLVVEGPGSEWNRWTFGRSLAAIGDLDGDGISELAAGVPSDDDGGELRGAVQILFLAADATLRGSQKISEWHGGALDVFRDRERFGDCLAGPGDIDLDGTPDLLVGSSSGVWTLFLTSGGQVRELEKLENGPAEAEDRATFGTTLAVGTASNANGTRPVLTGGERRAHDREDAMLWFLTLDPTGKLRAR